MEQVRRGAWYALYVLACFEGGALAGVAALALAHGGYYL